MASGKAEDRDVSDGSAWLVDRSNDLLNRARGSAQRAKRFRSQGRPLLAEAQLERAIQLLNAALTVYATNLSAQCLLISCFMQSGQLEEAKEQALAMLHDLVERKDGTLQDPALFLALAHCSLKLGQPQVATAVLQDAVRAFPWHPTPCALLAHVLDQEGRGEDARQAAALALERDKRLGRAACLTAAERADVHRCLSRQAGKGGQDSADSGGLGDSETHGGAAWCEGALVSLDRVEGASLIGSSNEGRLAPHVVGRQGLSQCTPSKDSQAKGTRSKPFGSRLSPHAEQGDLKEAALSDLERVFSNLLPASTVTVDDLQGGTDVEMRSACCACRKQRIVVRLA